MNEQAGIEAGAGGFDVKVKGNTDLQGAVIASTADASKNSLTTGTLSFSDIQNHSDYSSSTSGFSVSTSGGMPMLGQSASSSSSATTKSGVSQGTFTITSTADQKQDVASLNRDTSNPNGAVSKLPDVNTVLGNQTDVMNAATAAAEAVAKDVGTYADYKHNAALDSAKAATALGDTGAAAQYRQDAADWAEGGADRVGMHIVAGAVLGGLGGGSAFGAIGGAAGAGVSAELAPRLNELSSSIANADLTGNATADRMLGQIVSNVVACAAGVAVGGNAGAFAASNTDMYNRQLHPDERQWAKDSASKFAQFYVDQTGQTITADQAQQMLLANGYRLVDAAASKGPGGDATAVAFISQNAGGMFTATSAEYNSPFLYGNKDGSLTPEQRALPGAVANPKLGLAIAGALAAPAVLPALAAIPGAQIFGIDGALGSTAWTSAAGTGAISAGINAGSQYYQNGTVNPIDVAIAAISGGVGASGGLGWNVFVNGVGGATGTAINNAVYGKSDSIMFGGAVSGAGAAFGYGVGKGMETGINSILRPTINSSGWADVGKWAGPSGLNFLIPNNLAVIGAGVAGGSGSEAAGAAINGVKNQMGPAKKWCV